LLTYILSNVTRIIFVMSRNIVNVGEIDQIKTPIYTQKNLGKWVGTGKISEFSCENKGEKSKNNTTALYT